tara:strand:- start:159 stop:380 length:222 start_codon:yes stop_codon:yes gene_type:complete
MGKKDGIDGLKVGDLVEKMGGPRRRCLAIITEMCMEDYYEFNPWIRIVYVDDLGGYEWVRRPGVKIVGDKEQK